MPFLIVRDELTVDELSPRIGRRGRPPRLSPDEVDLIRRANPTVDLDRLRPGTVLRIPAALDPGRESVREDVVGPGIDAIVSTLEQTLAAAAEEARERAAADAKGLEAAREVLGRSDLAGAARRDKALAAHLARVAREIEQADERAAEADGRRQAALETWRADLEVVQELRD